MIVASNIVGLTKVEASRLPAKNVVDAVVKLDPAMVITAVPLPAGFGVIDVIPGIGYVTGKVTALLVPTLVLTVT